ncbi:MAG TPA: F0F1 ATP synthase subunit delta [Chthoniobacterales bacterium]|jgi:F-type H+-transporting ATPase subunit delta|nr:F0F1 ATP synthase subunit delta [Chthoniobacterales bacterium]
MRIAKEARRVSRQLFRHSFTEGKLDKEKISHMVESLIAEKPRHYVDALKVYQRLIRLETEKRHAVIESATQLNSALANQIVTNLRARYGEDLTIEFRTNPELLGGLRIKIGDDVWDGSVKNRLRKLQEQL